MATEASALGTLLFTFGALLPVLTVVVCAAIAFAKSCRLTAGALAFPRLVCLHARFSLVHSAGVVPGCALSYGASRCAHGCVRGC